MDRHAITSPFPDPDPGPLDHGGRPVLNVDRATDAAASRPGCGRRGSRSSARRTSDGILKTWRWISGGASGEDEPGSGPTGAIVPASSAG
ncbi:MAG TPA: hypothetical protein VMV41_03225 [Cellulomonadaceae bacterium]|nr:hypothetical protein [Cellulomonadaceae bacterium]